MIVYFMKTVFGPELFRIYKHAGEQGRNYIPNSLEFYSNSFISFFRGICVLCKWTSPLIMVLAYYRGYMTLDGIYSLWRFAYFVGIVLASSYLARGIGRYTNVDYQKFIYKFNHVNKSSKEDMALRKKFLLEHDFDMSHWKCDFEATSLPPNYNNKQHILIHNSIVDTIKYMTWRLLGKLCVDTFGLRMTYPGVVVQNLIGKVLLEGRTKFIEHKRAQRALIQTADKYRNKIDTLFIDQRSKATAGHSNVRNLASAYEHINDQNGKYLVICCDGNASFYEVGIFQIPIENGFSTLGWNYPGFGQSTGLPYPEQVTASADAIMQYAHSLGFTNENIILFSWSIGGFAVSWLSNQYPDVKAVVLDAAFDHIIPLAQQRMPSFATEFVDYTIKHNLNLDVAEYISNYKGPLVFIRRTFDEIISTVPRVAASNRGNELLIKTLRKRYPHLVNDDTIPYLNTWLSAKSDADRNKILNSYTTDIPFCESILVNYVKKNSNTYPLELGNDKIKLGENENDDKLDITKLSSDLKLTLALYLADRYLINYESSHCQQLPRELFKLPWTETDLLRYKF